MKWFLLAALAIAMPACSDAPTQGDCEKLLEHVIDLETQAAGAVAPSDKTELDKQKKAVADSIRSEFMETCLDKLPRSQVACGLKAKTLDDLSGCDQT